jgi:hypothetical protein
MSKPGQGVARSRMRLYAAAPWALVIIGLVAVATILFH